MTIDRSNLTVVVLHGAHGGPDTNWFPWLQAELDGNGIDVLRPRFPTPDGQSLKAWLSAYDRAVGTLPFRSTILVGHSLGAALALRLIERATEPAAGLFLAAAFVGGLGLPAYDAINHSFFAEPFDWPGIRARKGRLGLCWAGDDDPYVPIARSQYVAQQLNSTLEVIPGGGHLNRETDFLSFPHLRDAIISGYAGS